MGQSVSDPDGPPAERLPPAEASHGSPLSPEEVPHGSPLSPWLKLMVEEIARKREELEQARAEQLRRKGEAEGT